MLDQSLNVTICCFWRQVPINVLFDTLLALLISSGNGESKVITLCNDAKATMGHASYPPVPKSKLFLKSQLVGEEICETRYTRRFVISNPTKCRRWMMQLFSHWSDTWAIKVPTKGFSRINFEILKFWKIRRHHPIRNEITVLLSYSSRKTVKPTNRETFLKKIDFFRRYQPVLFDCKLTETNRAIFVPFLTAFYILSYSINSNILRYWPPW